jgi:myo-inositol-1(or 4)-monophosphatase
MKFIATAIEAAKEAGRLQIQALGKAHHIEYKGAANIVTEVDKQCEAIIVNRLRKEFPSHDILAEEGSDKNTNSDWRWIIDPLDGTVNYSHGYPLFAVSIALEHKGEVIAGVVFEPNRDELFSAEKGGGAFLNGRRISVSRTTELQNSLLDTGFAYNVHLGEKNNNLDHFADFLLKAQAVRRDGAAASDLCYVAAGRFDGFWELYLKSWDIAAGQLIIKEAGGKVSSFDGSPLDIYGKEIIASNGLIHEQMVKVLCQNKQKTKL